VFARDALINAFNDNQIRLPVLDYSEAVYESTY
ncbi:hypothetical protein BMETH_22041962260, partial [methanotrophic bacterial endosymbiont of Bathymodiolus sp.]